MQNTTKMNVFLDLENTVIDDWFSCIFLNQKIDKINNILQNLSIKFNKTIVNNENINLILFSAAVVNNEDLNRFNKDIKPILEEKLNLKFADVFIFSDENCFELAKQKGIKPLETDTLHDIFLFNIKEEIFNIIAKPNEINILFDDTVADKIVFEDLNFHNIDTAQTIKIFVHC
jgi:hypothetical protein